MKAGIDYIGVGVGACILDAEGKILLSERGLKAKNEVGKWEIPGGALEYGETLQQALLREVKEELDIDIAIDELLQVCDHLLPDEHQHWVSPTFLCHIVHGEPRIMEPEKCSQIGWFAIDEAVKLPLSVVTKKDIEFLQQRQK